MTPLAFMARLVALIPPPYHPLIRFHGLFAPHCSWRSERLIASPTLSTLDSRATSTSFMRPSHHE
jgi:hypothetical protein